MPLDNSNENTDLVKRLLDRLDSSSGIDAKLDQVEHSIEKLEGASEAQDKVIDQHNLDINEIKRDLQSADKKIEDIQSEFDTELNKVNKRVDDVAGSRTKYVEYIFTLILGALVPSIINMILH